jgi:hypothetical protein
MSGGWCRSGPRRPDLRREVAGVDDDPEQGPGLGIGAGIGQHLVNRAASFEDESLLEAGPRQVADVFAGHIGGSEPGHEDAGDNQNDHAAPAHQRVKRSPRRWASPPKLASGCQA